MIKSGKIVTSQEIVQSVNRSIHLCFGCHSAIVEIVDTSMNLQNNKSWKEHPKLNLPQIGNTDGLLAISHDLSIIKSNISKYKPRSTV
jgi:hypothetical protein